MGEKTQTPVPVGPTTVRAQIKALDDERALLVAPLLTDELGDLERSNVTERFVRLTHYVTALKWVIGERTLL